MHGCSLATQMQWRIFMLAQRDMRVVSVSCMPEAAVGLSEQVLVA